MLAILIVDADSAVLDSLYDLLTGAGHSVTMARERDEAFSQLRDEVFDLVIYDVPTSAMDGLTLLRTLRRAAPDAEIILMTRFATVPDAIAAIRARALDYLPKPIDSANLLGHLPRIESAARLRRSLRPGDRDPAKGGAPDAIVGRAPEMVRVREHITVIAGSDSPVLILGESGTGKELVARAIHEQSARRDGPLVAVNCGALPTTLIESELFGHERGAFTGAERRRNGRFLAADRGTLFLDEVADLPLEAQVKLLRVLEEGTFQPIGTNRTIKVDVRVVSATNRDLRQLIRQGKFREDLYYRLRVFEVSLPPLRARTKDLPLLVEHFAKRYARPGEARLGLSSAAWAALLDYPFPGNVRELENAINHAVTLARGSGEIDLPHLPPEIREPDERGTFVPPSLSRAVERFERDYIRRALAITGGEEEKAAQILGISGSSLQDKLAQTHAHETDTPGNSKNHNQNQNDDSTDP
jgi:DNA-binding NtrC family response regulator